MKKFILSIAISFLFLASLTAQITHEQADAIVLEQMNGESRAYTLYTLDGVQTEMVINTSDGEIVELDYPCWVYFVNFTNEISAKFWIVKENSGSLLEINVREDDAPDNLTEWREVFNIPQTDYAPLGAEWYYTYTTGYSREVEFHHAVSEGDTIIKGYHCRIVRQYNDNTDTANAEYIFRQEQGKVYYYYQNQFHLLYNFDAEIGDTVQYSIMGKKYLFDDSTEPYFWDIDTVFSVRYIVENITTNTQNLKTFVTRILEEDRIDLYFSYTYTYTEKIGLYKEFILKYSSDYWLPETPPQRYLRCYSDSNINYVTDEWATMSLPCNAFQQSIFAPIGTEWYYSYSPDSIEGDYNFIVSERDTIIEGCNCRVLRQYYGNSGAVNKNYIIKQEYGKVYYHYQNQFHLLFDFYANVYDTVTFTFMYKKFSTDFPLGKDTLLSVRFRVEHITTDVFGFRTFTASILEEDVLHFQDVSIPDFSEYIYTERVGFQNLLGNPLYREFIPMFDNVSQSNAIYFRGLRCYSGPGYGSSVDLINIRSDEWAATSLPCHYRE